MGKLKNAYALLVGVGKDLPVTVKDAKAIHSILADKTMAGYLSENITLLTGRKATRKNILAAFDKLIATVDEDSSVMLFYSGHGGTYSDNSFLKEEHWKPEAENQKYFHLCPYDYDPVEYETTWIKAEEVKEKIQALKSRRLIFFLDCCHATGMVKGISLAGNEPKLIQADGLAQNLDDGRGMSIISSCREDQESYIMEGDKNSLYTKCMLEVLQGENKTHFDEPYVRISEVVQYIFKKVPEGSPHQNPYANLQIYDDFILSYVPKERFKISSEKTIDALVKDYKKPVKELVTKFRETEKANSAILFIHGFSGEASGTFGNVPQFLMDNQKMDGWDMFPLGYSENVPPEMGKAVWASLSDLKRNSDYLVTSLKHKYSKYKRVAIVAHSLGGLVAQQAILDLPAEERNRISHLLLFGTPSGGLSEKGLQSLSQNSLKELGSGGAYIKSLRERWDKTFNNTYPFAFKTVAGTKDAFVPVDSSLEPFSKEYREMVEGNHFSMVNVDNEDNDSYQLIVQTLTNNTFLNKFSVPEEINIALGEYDAVIKNLLPKIDSLDAQGLERLILALEGADREKDAIDILQKHPLAKDNSNLLGVIGGRYKRKYLNTFSTEDRQKAIKYYKEALQIAETKDDYKQIYYPAINLAFLSLLNDDQPAMNDFAKKAIAATEKDPFNSMWKLATLGEASLYLGDFEKAMEYYVKAAKMAGIREKISIYSNAFNAFTRLMGTDSEEEPFIKFLKVNFLS